MTQPVQVITKCVVCNKVHTAYVEKVKYDRWKAGENIQNVWPEMSADEREQLISGTCPKCWDELWSGDEDDA